jgi:hypothetical protein
LSIYWKVGRAIVVFFPLAYNFRRRRKGTSRPPTMNITYCPLRCATDREVWVRCPWCRSERCHRHGCYARKGFHLRNRAVSIPLVVPRYRCCNPQCPCRTFSLLPPMVLRYCRFFWPCLCTLRKELSRGLSAYHLARHVWHVGRGVIVRAAALLERLGPWVASLHRELTDGKADRELPLMVKVISGKLGPVALLWRWYRHRYGGRFSPPGPSPHNLTICCHGAEALNSLP